MINKSVARCSVLFIVFSFVLSGIVQAQDISLYEVVREEYFAQGTTNRPDTVNARGHTLSAYVVPSSDGSVLSASLRFPKERDYSTFTNYNGSFSLLNQPGGSIVFPSAAPSGTYEFHVQCANDGNKALKLNLPGPANGIQPMRVANYSELQAADASQSIEVQWDKPARTGKYDYLQFHLYDPTGKEVQAQTLPLEQTNLILSPGVLKPNTTNHAYLSVVHYFSVSSSKLPHWCIVERRLTDFHIVTRNPAGVFKFSPMCVVANETNGTATMCVERTQDSTGQVTVDYFSSDSTAQAGVNYLPVSGTLVFADGVTNQTFTVSLLNNGATNPPLTVHFSLTNATGGAGLVVRPHAVLTILDSQSAPGSNVNAFLIGQVEFYAQTNADIPLRTPLSVTSRFYAAVEPKFPGAVTNATLKLPNGKTVSLSRDFENYQIFLERSQDFPSPASMISCFRSGKYGFAIDTLTGGSHSESASLGAERSFSVPHLTNWVEAQTINPEQPFTLKWASFSGAASNDIVRVAVRNAAGEHLICTPSEFMPGVLPATTRSFTIPANTLEYGSKYLVDLIFVKMVSVAKDPHTGIRSGIASVHTTSLYINTVK